jgi:hypothetical protein
VAIELMLSQLVKKLGLQEDDPVTFGAGPTAIPAMPTAGPGTNAPVAPSVASDTLSVKHPGVKPRVMPVLGGSLRADTEGRGIVPGPALDASAVRSGPNLRVHVHVHVHVHGRVHMHVHVRVHVGVHVRVRVRVCTFVRGPRRCTVVLASVRMKCMCVYIV